VGPLLDKRASHSSGLQLNIFRRKAEMAEPQTFATTTVNGKTEAILEETKKNGCPAMAFLGQLAICTRYKSTLVKYWFLRSIFLVVISIILDQISVDFRF